MNQYKQILRDILDYGTWQSNRTGIDSIKGTRPAIFQHHMDAGFPIPTGRRAPFKSAAGELCGFLRGVTSAADFRALGCKFWDQNANENTQWLANPFRRQEDQLGDVYGAQWRKWPAFKMMPVEFTSMDIVNKMHAEGWKTMTGRPCHPDTGKEQYVFFKEIDQLGDCVRTIITNPDDRRILFHAWNPAKLDEIALPACHLLYQFVPTAKTKELALSVTIRSNDMPLGWPSNVIEAALMLHLVARLTGYKPTWLTVISNDAHIYRNQLDMVNEYLARPVHTLPSLQISRVPDIFLLGTEAYKTLNEQDPSMNESAWLKQVGELAVQWLDLVEPTDFGLNDYVCGEPITAAMAV